MYLISFVGIPLWFSILNVATWASDFNYEWLLEYLGTIVLSIYRGDVRPDYV